MHRSGRCLADVRCLADATKSNVILYQRHRYPPHFEVVSAHATETWAVMQVRASLPSASRRPACLLFHLHSTQGRNNLFHALILLVYCVKTKFAGYLGQLWLGVRDVSLLAVIEQ